MRVLATLIAVQLVIAGCSKTGENDVCVPVLSGWATPESGQPVYLLANSVRVYGHAIRWNGVTVDERTLETYLRKSAELNPRPFVIFDPQSSDCQFAVRVRDVIDRNYPCREGACGQGTKEAFERTPFRPHRGPPA
jgi:hypothetical protein